MQAIEQQYYSPEEYLALIVAGEPEYINNRTDTITNPQIIIEVLSDSTQGYDRSGKFKTYRTIPTFEEYLLVDQTKINVEHFSKTANKRWSFYEYDVEDETITLNSVQFQISLADLYNKVKEHWFSACLILENRYPIIEYT